MATYDWLGGYGRYSAARHWDPSGVPGIGDKATIAGGEVVLRRQSVQAVLSIGAADASSPPALDLRDASAVSVAVPGNSYVLYVSDPNTAAQPDPRYATINVAGDSSLGSLGIGALGDGPAEADVNLGAGATLTTGFFVGNGSTLNVNGADSASLSLADSPTGSQIRGGRVVADAPIAGQGTIYMDGPFVPGLRLPLPTGFIPHAASLEVGSGVGSDVTVAIRAGNLQIDNPMAFAGRVDLISNLPSPTTLFINDAGPQSVMLEGIAATSYGFDDASHTMTLFNGAAAVDQLGFTSDITARSFAPDGSGGSESAIGVAQTASGVLLSHLPASAADSAVPIPMRT